MTTSGATVYISDIGMKTSFILASPMKLEMGTSVSLYVEMTTVSSYSSQAKIVNIELK